MTELKAPFTVDSFDASVIEEPAQGPPRGRATLTKTYTGPVTGTAELEMLTCGQEGYVAIERIVGEFEGRAGTVVVQHGGVIGGLTESRVRRSPSSSPARAPARSPG